jgi:hypothetical protein
MIRLLIAIACFLAVFPIYAQQPSDSAKLPEYGWKHGLVAGLSLSQVAVKDWAQGGEDAFAYTGLLQGKSRNDQPSTDWTNTYQFAFGQTKLGDRGVRKTDDKIELESVLLYKFYEDAKLNPYVAASLRTQFATGFTYDSLDRATAASAFFDPAYLTQSIGASYHPVKSFTTRLGAALREVLTSSYNQYADDPATPEIEKVFVQGGIESVTNAEWQADDNVLLTTELNLFSPVKTPDRIILRSTSGVAAKVSRWVTVLLGMQIINEPNVSPLTQIRESLALGLSYTIL